MRISDWSSDVCSSDLRQGRGGARSYHPRARLRRGRRVVCRAGVARRGGDAKSHYGTGRQYRVPARGVPLKGWVFAPHGFGVSARRRNGAVPRRTERACMTEIASRAQLRLSFLRWAVVTVPLVLFLGFLSGRLVPRSEEHTSELQSLMRISYAVF